MTTLVSYGVTTAAGAGVDALWSALVSGTSLRDADGVCRWRGVQHVTARERLQYRLSEAAAEAFRGQVPENAGARWGVVLASTKGVAEDLVWGSTTAEIDPFDPVLNDFLAAAQLRPARTLCVSNACASSHAALYVAEQWLRKEIVDHVLVLAVDEVREFVASGFRALGALSPTGARPMAEDRDGLQLGEGAAALWLSRVQSGNFAIGPVGFETEGLSITRPSPDGGSLARAASIALAGNGAVDFVVAHATATLANDLVEARAIATALAEVGAPVRTPVVGTKGCVGHTLGASGAVDLIAAAESLARGKLFPIAGTRRPDSSLPVAAFYVGSDDKASIEDSAPKYQRALVTALGFGGVHAAMAVRWQGEVR